MDVVWGCCLLAVGWSAAYYACSCYFRGVRALLPSMCMVALVNVCMLLGILVGLLGATYMLMLMDEYGGSHITVTAWLKLVGG